MERNIDKSIFLKPIASQVETTEITENISTNKTLEQNNVIDELSVRQPIISETAKIISLNNLNHSFDKGTNREFLLFKDFNLVIEDIKDKPQVVSIMGGSGCGKSCILRIIAGLMKVDSGEVLIYGKPLKEYGHIPMVFQQYSNYEWMTVLDNIALPMILKGVSKKEAHEKAMELIKLVGLEEHANKFAKNTTLSGGQLQRISIARCLASGSQIMLLDEATGALDIKMKREVQDLILKICHTSNVDVTILNVTHSIEEAAYISNRVLVLGAKPCTVYQSLDIDYGADDNNRGQWVLESQEYSDYSKEIAKALDNVCITKK